MTRPSRESPSTPPLSQSPHLTTLVAGLGREHAREWRQFARWAAAADHTALPANAATVLAYLAEHPGTPATQRGRVTAINTAHQRAGHPAPGEAEAVRRALNPGRGARLDAARDRAAALLPQLPVTGWTDGLHGRRDAVILLLATSGLSWRQIAALTQREVTVTDTAVTIGPQPLVELPATGLPASCPVRVFRRWIAVLAHAPKATGHLEMERILTSTTEADPSPVLPPVYGALPFLTDFDDRGLATGYVDELDPLTAETIAAITTEHLLRQHGSTPAGDLDPDYYARGVAARWRTQPILDELDDLLDRFDALTARLTLNDFETGI
ncbi:hypothetical protein [Nocardia sp. NPDC004260]